MKIIATYQITQQLYESSHTIVHRAYHTTTKQPVVLKRLKADYPSPEDIARLKHEYDILQYLDLPGVHKVYSIETAQHRWFTVLEDFGGDSLTKLNTAGSYSLIDFLHLALDITDIVGSVHQHYIVHKDINPANIVYNPKTQIVKLIDFGIATMLSREVTCFHNDNVLEGTLPYMAPEQTGRLKRAIDYRTDFYALGVTFYELLTGKLPFESQDTLELIHSHIARNPLPPSELRHDIPPLLSQIILKLMAKNAEDRYQSAYGLKADLQYLLSVVQKHTEQPDDSLIAETQDYHIGHYDITNQFRLPNKLYGHQEQRATLLATFERVCQGTSEILCLTGESGSGKTALVQELSVPVAEHRGYFIQGQFAQFDHSLPYAAIIRTFQSLIRQLLTEDETKIAAWREELHRALGNNGQVISELIPEIDVIIGEQPDVLPLGPVESQNRLNRVFQNFIRVFSRPEHPLVLFLDECQYADEASLRLIELLMKNLAHSQQPVSLLVVLTYPEKHIDKEHPLPKLIESLQKEEISIHSLGILPLTVSDVEELLGDTLHKYDGSLQPLAKVVVAKTGGNPFFIHEFLTSSYIKGFINFNTNLIQWEWDIAHIQTHSMTDNVIDLLVEKIERLDHDVQRVIKIASCIGDVFDIPTIAVIAETPEHDIETRIRAISNEGLFIAGKQHQHVIAGNDESLLGMNVAYRFSHERIRQVVYDLTAPEQQAEIHWRIGIHLLQTVADKEVYDDTLFYIINQLNKGYTSAYAQENPIVPEDTIAPLSSTNTLAHMNLDAGKKARLSAAYELAWQYFHTGLRVLPAQSWQNHYELSLQLTTNAAEAAYLSGHFEDMEHLIAIVLQQAHTLLDKIPAYEIKLDAYSSQTRFIEAIATGRDVLKLLGISLPEKPSKIHILLAFAKIKIVLAKTFVHRLETLPAMTDPYKQATMRILASMSDIAYLSQPILFPFLSFHMVELSVKHGNARESCFAYMTYALIVSGFFNDINTGYAFGELALRLLESSQAWEFKARVYMIMYHLIQHWKGHAKDGLQPLLEAYQSGMETGDLHYGVFSLFMHSTRSYILGKELAALQQDMEDNQHIITGLGEETILRYQNIYHHAVVNLQGKVDDPTYFGGSALYEQAMMTYHQNADDKSGLFLLHANKLWVCYLLGAYEQALEHANQAEIYNTSGRGLLLLPLLYFCDSLVRIHMLSQHASMKKEEIPRRHGDTETRTGENKTDSRARLVGGNERTVLKRIEANQKKLEKWSHYAPMNFLHKWTLVEAELARLRGNRRDAREYYEQAIELSHTYGYIMDEALANELAGLYCLEQKQGEMAHIYLRKAHYAYNQWGATAKVLQLETAYPFLVNIPKQTQNVTTTTRIQHTGTKEQASSLLDLSSVMKASHAISSEIVLDSLLEKLLYTVLENAGAERGLLLLERDGTWSIVVDGKLDQQHGLLLQPTDQPTSLEQKVSRAVINYVTHTQNPIVLEDARHSNYRNDSYIQQQHIKSLLCIPLIHKANLIGMLYLENSISTGAFTQDRVEVLQLLCSQIVISIENAQLYKNVQSSEKKYRSLFEDSRDVIFIATPNGKFIDINPASELLFGYTRDELLQMNIPDLYYHQEERQRLVNEIDNQGEVRNFEVILKHKNGNPIDCLLTVSVRYTEEGHIHKYHGIVRDITQQKQAQQERMRLMAMERELSVAQGIQKHLLPPPHPAWDEIEVVCFSTSAREVGGDLYIYHQVDTYAEDKDTASTELSAVPNYVLGVGDVSGKGIPAALLMAVSVASFQSLVSQRLDPTSFLMLMNKALANYTQDIQQNCAMVYLDIQIHTPSQDMVEDSDGKGNSSARATMRAANAGCIPPIVKHADGTVAWVEVGGFPLGSSASLILTYPYVSLDLSAGDMVILCSDGVIEAKNASEEMFGFDQFEDVVQAGTTTSAEAMLAHIRDAVDAFIGDSPLHDDETIVVVQV